MHMRTRLPTSAPDVLGSSRPFQNGPMVINRPSAYIQGGQHRACQVSIRLVEGEIYSL